MRTGRRRVFEAKDGVYGQVIVCRSGRVLVRLPSRGARGQGEVWWWRASEPERGVNRVKLAPGGERFWVINDAAFDGACGTLAVSFQVEVPGKEWWRTGKGRMKVVPLQAGKGSVMASLGGAKVLSGSIRFTPRGRWLMFGAAEPFGLYAVRARDGHGVRVVAMEGPKIRSDGGVYVLRVR